MAIARTAKKQHTELLHLEQFFLEGTDIQNG